MRIRKFEAPSVQEALPQVRQELGPDAVILYTRKLKRGGFLGLGSVEIAEVTAGVDLGPENGANATPSYTGPAERAAALGGAASPGRSGSLGLSPVRPKAAPASVFTP